MKTLIFGGNGFIGKGLRKYFAQKNYDVTWTSRKDPGSLHVDLLSEPSVRAALAICDLVGAGIDFEASCLMALPSRIELISNEEDPHDIILKLVRSGELPMENQKKK